jgi:hypothetical protein
MQYGIYAFNIRCVYNINIDVIVNNYCALIYTFYRLYIHYNLAGQFLRYVSYKIKHITTLNICNIEYTR